MNTVNNKKDKKTMKTNHNKKNVQFFNEDVATHGGYLYTREQLSCKLANERISQSRNQLYPFQGKSILDIGCGDGTFSIELVQQGASHVVGIDPVPNAIDTAQKKAATATIRNIYFQVGNIYELPSFFSTHKQNLPMRENNFFDCVVLRGILHHLPDPEKALQCVAPFTSTILIIEPNGYNPIVKLIEKTIEKNI